jgi:hypothetical protein
MACVDVALGAVGSADLVVTNDGADETALGEVLSTANVRLADTSDTALGDVSTTTDVQVAESPGDCLNAFPAACDAGWPSCYRLAGYSDHDLTACGGCEVSAESAWDGTFADYGTAGCPDIAAWFVTGLPLSVDGCILYYISFIQFSGPAGYYVLTVVCYDATNDLTYPVWLGYKYDGASPAGTYTFDSSDCGNSQDLTVEECP